MNRPENGLNIYLSRFYCTKPPILVLAAFLGTRVYYCQARLFGSRLTSLPMHKLTLFHAVGYRSIFFKVTTFCFGVYIVN
jgi:hypothetical protein